MTNTINSSYMLSNYQNQQRKTGSSSLGKDDFLKILMTQLQNQDPLNPMQDKDFVAQMATFSSLEQMTNMNSTIQKLVDSEQQNQLISYNQFVGKDVTWHKLATSDDSNAPQTVEQGTGKVVSIQFKDNSVQFKLEDGTTLDPANISQVNETTTENSLLQASLLIGKKVTYLDEQKEERSAMVKSVSFKDGKTLFQLDDELNTKISSQQMTKIE
ncbi:flagellar hook assembly protein FlgD [Neobacillus sp. PS3-40]|uniref:flagellar hook assembly protein FlgD n=1 Tax=Neobacillus sp. PS3-40 TaxID=3070679 RepID=UPI0027DFD274|nr:flagellar hook assembly protein FlgD [Neobacillus sp. PS3-40]WML43705.1 flagellar hook assembly protein FlgD [Neobacillus sp. PS3-40]